METWSTLAALASLDHSPRLCDPALCGGFELFAGASNELPVMLGDSPQIATECIDVRLAVVLRHDRARGELLAIADVGSRSGLVGRVRDAPDHGAFIGFAGAKCAAITSSNRTQKPGARISLGLATCCLRVRGPMPPSKVSHHA